MSVRNSKTIGPFLLGAGGPNQSVAAAASFEIPADGKLWVQALIDGGAVATPPSDAPAGTWQLWLSSVDVTANFARFPLAETGDFSLAGLAPTGNNALLSAMASFVDVPAGFGRLIYVRTSGGAASRATLYVPRA